MPSKRQIPLDELTGMGISLAAEEMTNGEIRVRLTTVGGDKIVIVYCPHGAWQDSAMMVRDDSSAVLGDETVTVVRGRVAVAIPDGPDKASVSSYGVGSTFTIDPNQPHNTWVQGLLMAAPIGNWAGVKRIACPDFDALTRHLVP